MLLPCLSLLSDQPTRDSSSHGSKCHNCSSPSLHTRAQTTQTAASRHSCHSPMVAAECSAMSNFNIRANIFEGCFCFLSVQALHDKCHVWTAVIVTRKNSWTWWEKWISSCVIPYMHQWPLDELCQTHADACFIPAPGWFCSLSVTRCAASAPQLSKTGCDVLTTTVAHTFPPLHPTTYVLSSFLPDKVALSEAAACAVFGDARTCASLVIRRTHDASHEGYHMRRHIAQPDRTGTAKFASRRPRPATVLHFLKWCVHWRREPNSHQWDRLNLEITSTPWGKRRTRVCE